VDGVWADPFKRQKKLLCWQGIKVNVDDGCTVLVEKYNFRLRKPGQVLKANPRQIDTPDTGFHFRQRLTWQEREVFITDHNTIYLLVVRASGVSPG